MKNSGGFRLAVLTLLILTVFLLAACGKTAAEPESISKTSDAPASSAAIPDNSILYFNDEEGGAKLIQFFQDGKIPEEASFRYDQMGANPDITITDSEEIQKLYSLLSKVGVIGETDMSVTDCYHFVQFKLADDLYIHYSFEGDIWCCGNQNYELENTKDLFQYMLELTDLYRDDQE